MHPNLLRYEAVDFELTEEQVQLRAMVREFAAREIAPHVMEWDEAARFPLEVVKEMGRLGLMGCIFPAEYGGAGGVGAYRPCPRSSGWS